MNDNVGANDGDWVRAIEDAVDGRIVEGVLRLRHVPLRDYVQVVVENDAGSYIVAADTVDVMRPGVAVVDDEDVDDPLRGDIGWRRVTSLPAARRDGLIKRPAVPPGTTSAGLEAGIRNLARPLVDGGWAIQNVSIWVEWDRVEVACTVERDGSVADLMHDAAGNAIQLFPGEVSPTDGPTEPIGCSEATVDACAAAYREVGWL